MPITSPNPELTAREACRETLDELGRKVRSRAERVRKDPSNEKQVHKLRTATRRAGSAAAFFEPVLSSKRAKKAQKQWKKFRKAAGVPREADVLLGVVERFEGEHPLAARAVRDRLESNRKKAVGRLRQQCRKKNRSKAGARVEKLIKSIRGGKNRTFRDLARESIGEALKDLRKEIKQDSGSLDDLHEIRIAEKRLRYCIEIAASCCPEAAADILDRLTGIQDELGRLNDLRDLTTVLHKVRKSDDPDPDTAREIDGLLEAVEGEVARGASTARDWLASDAASILLGEIAGAFGVEGEQRDAEGCREEAAQWSKNAT